MQTTILSKIITHNSKRWEYLFAVEFKVRQARFNGELSLLATTTKQAGYSSCFQHRTVYVSSLCRLMPICGRTNSCWFTFAVSHNMIWFQYPLITELMHALKRSRGTELQKRYFCWNYFIFTCFKISFTWHFTSSPPSFLPPGEFLQIEILCALNFRKKMMQHGNINCIIINIIIELYWEAYIPFFK